MRRVVGAILLALGAFLVVAALLLPVYVAPALVKVPLDQDSQTVAEATDATVFRVATLSEEDGVDLKAIRTVRGDVKNGDSKRAVFDVFLYIKDGDGKEVTYSTDRVALDRRTSEAINCCGENVNGKATEHKGLSYKFPFDTEKKTYEYFDITAKKTYPIRFLDTETIKGLETYKFQMNASDVKIGEQELPGKLFGTTEPTVKADRIYNNTRTIWVEPKTGVIIKGREEQKQTFRNADGEDKVTVIDGTLEFNDKTITEAVDTAEEGSATITLLERTLPLVLGVLGVLLLIVGLILTLLGRSTAAEARPGRRRAGRTHAASPA